MILALLLMLLGFGLLIKGADFFVKSAAFLAQKFGVSELVIGLTIVAVGTSIPELVTSLSALNKGETGIVLGNIIGSNMANIGLIIGLVAGIYGISTHATMLRRDAYILLFVSAMFAIFILNGSFSRLEGALFLLFYLVYLLFLIEKRAEVEREFHFKEFLVYAFRFHFAVSMKDRVGRFLKNLFDGKSSRGSFSFFADREIRKHVGLLFISGAVVGFGGDMVITQGLYLAGVWGLPKNVIGLSMVAIGTSLPEVSVSLAAARRGLGDIALGNIIGSNIANLFLIGGLSALLVPMPIPPLLLTQSIPVMLFLTVFLIWFMRSHWKIVRFEGWILFACYTAFMVFLFTVQY